MVEDAYRFRTSDHLNSNDFFANVILLLDLNFTVNFRECI